MKLHIAGHTANYLEAFSLHSNCGHIKDGVGLAFENEGAWILSYEDLKRLYEAATRARKGQDGNFVRLTRKEIESMSWAGSYGAGNWRDESGIYSDRLIGEPTFKGIIDKDKWTKVNERSRTYHFADGITTSVDNPAWLWPSSSGTHYIKDSYGKVHIINKAWVRITITE